MEKPLILIIEDEDAIRDMIRFALEPAGFMLSEAATIQDAQRQLQKQLPGLILLDWMLPGGSGIQYIKQLKSDTHTQHIPVIMLTAKAEEFNKISGLEAGADDYITKPFSPRELIARIKSVLRRGVLISVDNRIRCDKLQIDLDTHAVTVDQQIIDVTPAEFRLLHFLLTHRERVYSREQLLDAVSPNQLDREARTIDTQIRRLRDRLRPFGYDVWIKTVRGAGYQFSGEKS